MAKITLADGMVIEGTVEELKAMTEAFGVKTEESEYVLVTDREPKAGDFVKFSEEYADDDTDLTAGKYYKITKVEDGTCVVFFDDDCDMRFKRSDVSGVEVYELVAEQAPAAEPSQYREVKREAKVGELIKIVDAYDEPDYKNGDIRKVTGAYPETSAEYAHVEIEPNSAAVLTEEYVVLEPVATTTTLTHNGAEYTLVDRKAQPGDVVIIGESGESFFFKSGKPYEVVDEIVDDSIAAIGDDGVSYGLYVENFNRTPGNVKVYQPKVAPVAPKLQVGDYAKVVGSSNGYDKVGDIVKIVNDECGMFPFRMEHLDGSYAGYQDEKSLVKATDEEVAEAKRQAEEKAAAARWAKIGRKPNEFKQGDIVRATRCLGDKEVIIGEMDDDGKPDHVGNYGITSFVDGEYRSVRDVELITPVEQRFDLADGADD